MRRGLGAGHATGPRSGKVVDVPTRRPGECRSWKPDPLPNQVQELLDDLDGFSAAPSGHQKEKLAELMQLVNDASTQVKKIADEELPALNKKMNDAGIPHIVPAPPQPRSGRGGEVEPEQ